jgi:hypothetical protein
LHPTLARASVLVLAAALLSACSTDDSDSVTAAAAPSPSVVLSQEPSPEPSPSPTLAPPSPAAAPAKAAAPPAKPAKPKRPKPKRQPVTPPPPPPVKAKPVHKPGPPQCSKKNGKDATKAAVRDALTAAASRDYWTKTKVVLPVNLVKAIAWQESGWQSAIVACDGGIGTMQIMPATATWLNNRFGSTFDINTVDGNTLLGAEYLAWEIKYFGDLYYAEAADPYDVLNNPGMLDAVISGYNYGVAKVDPSQGAAGIPNPKYVTPVKALMTNCVCLTY